MAKSNVAGVIPYKNGLASVASPNGFLSLIGIFQEYTIVVCTIWHHNRPILHQSFVHSFRSPSRLARIFLYGSPLPHHCHTIATIGNTIAPVPQCDNCVTPLAHIRTIPGFLFHNTDYATIETVR